MDRNRNDVHCCAECGKEEGGGSLKACKSCMQVKYCDASCQRDHWPTHKAACKLRAAELRDEALFKDPPPKEDCPICFLPMPSNLIHCVSLPYATVSSVPINDFAKANVQLANEQSKIYYPCCGKSLCKGCAYSFAESGNIGKCPFCNSDHHNKSDEDRFEYTMKRVEANDPTSICLLAQHYHHGWAGLQQNHAKAVELYARAADLGCSEAHSYLGDFYDTGGNLKKASFHYEAAAMAGDERARNNIGSTEYQAGNLERAVKHWTIAASAGCCCAMNELRMAFEEGEISKESIDSTLKAYNSSCSEVRSEARDAHIRAIIEG